VTPARPGRRGPAPAAAKHRDILDAAVKLFARQGVARTGTREIAEAAGTTERTLFKHFGSKAGLAEAVVAEAVVPHIAPMSQDSLRRAIEGPSANLADWHRTMLRMRLKQLSETGDLNRLLMIELLRDDALKARYAEYWMAAVWRPLLGLFGDLQAAGRMRTDLPAASLVRVFMTTTLGFLIMRLTVSPELDWDDEAEIEAVVSTFTRAVAPLDEP
jgi:AcrR family transcriptional regulator